jgi:hypothetical protein
MSEPTKTLNPFDLLIEQIRAVVREEIAAAMKSPETSPLLWANACLRWTNDQCRRRTKVKRAGEKTQRVPGSGFRPADEKAEVTTPALGLPMSDQSQDRV